MSSRQHHFTRKFSWNGHVMSGMLPHLEQRERLIDKKLIDKKLGELQDDNTEERLINLAVTGNTLEKNTSDN